MEKFLGLTLNLFPVNLCINISSKISLRIIIRNKTKHNNKQADSSFSLVFHNLQYFHLTAAPDLVSDFAGFVAKFRIHNLLRINHIEVQYCRFIHYSIQMLFQHQSEEKEDTKVSNSGPSFCKEEKNLYLHQKSCLQEP